MSEDTNLDDPNQTTFCIPFAGDNDYEGEEIPFPQALHGEHDLPEGVKLRIDTYTVAWKKCLDRIKSIIHALHAPVIASVQREVHSSYATSLHGLPYSEIPVIGITDPSSSSAFLDQIADAIDAFDLDGDLTDDTAFTSHLYPNDCISLTSTLKVLIAGFVDRPHILDKGRPATSLVNYDMELLLAWYSAIRETYDITPRCRPKLVILLHDFEQVDPLVVQDLFTISSLYITRLPFVFILALSSPASPSFLHSTYPRSIVALLRVSTYTVPAGIKVLEEVLLRTFFDLEFEPDIIIGPSVLTYLTDYYNRHNSSLDAALNILHLAHLKHFSGEPLTLIVKSTPVYDLLSQPASLLFVEALATRLQPSHPSSDSAPDLSISSLIAATNAARSALYSRARRIRIGFRIIKLVQDFMRNEGYKGLNWGDNARGIGIVDVMISSLQGGLGSDIKYLGTMVKKLKTTQLEALLNAIHSFYNSMSLDIRSEEEEARTNVVLAINALPREANDTTGASSQVAAKFGDWVIEYLNDTLTPLEDAPLWDVWFTGASPFPADLINPSVRATVVAGLLHPHDFGNSSHMKDDEQEEPSLWELPDTSILFHRYLDSGKMLNLYDWFTSFQQELETQRQNLKERAAAELKSLPASPKKRGGKGKAKAESEEDIERWHLELQARFMRAMQDLDYLGFLKHTGRKADHVQRVSYDMHD
ncbi:hypothetical protein DXG01_007339 [Tephrocybe rancida]|nr:hypothetical protein DXG01_007339 [Tephrocybe rancida]